MVSHHGIGMFEGVRDSIQPMSFYASEGMEAHTVIVAWRWGACLGAEAFFTDTAAEVTPAHELDERPIGSASCGSNTEKLQSTDFQQAQGDRRPEWLIYTSTKEITMPDPQTHDRADLIEPNAANRYEISAKDLPLSCPMPGMYLWNSHPKVYLPIHETGEERCPYCSAVYVLKDWSPEDMDAVRRGRRQPVE